MPAPLPGKVKQLGWISFFADVCSEMVYPVIPLFLVGVLKAPAAALGLVEGVAEGVVSFMKGWSGFHSDKTGRRLPYIQWGYGLSALGKPLLGIAYVWPVVLIGRVVDRFGKGIRTTARDAMIADSVEEKDLGRAFGFHRAMDTAGALLGVLAGFVLLYLMPGRYREIFLIAFIPGIVATFLTLRLREPRASSAEPNGEAAGRVAKAVGSTPQPPSSSGTSHPDEEGGFRALLAQLPPGYWHAFWLSNLFALANTSDMFLMARAKETGLSATDVILAYALYNVTYTALAYSVGALSDRIGRWPVVGGGWVLYAIVYVGFAIAGAGQGSLIWLLFALYGVYQAMAQGATKALVAQFTPATIRGAGLGFFFMVSGFVTLAGNLAMGLIWDQVSAQAAFFTAGGMAFLSAVLIPIALRSSTPQPPSSFSGHDPSPTNKEGEREV